MKSKALRDQLIALSLTILTCLSLIGLLWLEIIILNTIIGEKIHVQVRLADVMIGLVIYLKTSIDFAIFIGRLMEKNPGLKGRIGIEIGTALGNALGTFAVLLIWSFFKEVTWLLAAMVFVAALVLVRLAEDSLEHVDTKKTTYPKWFRLSVTHFEGALKAVNKFTNPLLSRLIPSRSLKITTSRTLMALLSVSFVIPFILGLDDFAGYVPLFNIVNVFGFSIGVLVGHMILNILLYLSPKRTIAAVKNPIVSVFGSVAFIGLAIWGLMEAVKLVFGLHG